MVSSGLPSTPVYLEPCDGACGSHGQNVTRIFDGRLACPGRAIPALRTIPTRSYNRIRQSALSGFAAAGDDHVNACCATQISSSSRTNEAPARRGVYAVTGEMDLRYDRQRSTTFSGPAHRCRAWWLRVWASGRWRLKAGNRVLRSAQAGCLANLCLEFDFAISNRAQPHLAKLLREAGARVVRALDRRCPKWKRDLTVWS